MSSILKKPKALRTHEDSENQPAISVTTSAGNLASGPKVAMGIKLADDKGLLIELGVEEAFDLANELLMAIRMSERKYSLQFGAEWRRAV
jgi:hypothetical protein